MPVEEFPNVSLADEHGLLCIGGDLSVETLLLAYCSGIFPWPIPGHPLTWFAPPQRSILYTDKFHIPRRLQREIRQNRYTYRIDTDFRGVISACAERSTRPHRQGTWITKAMIDAYMNLADAGYAHSVEVYDDSALIGGLYGVSIGSLFCAESMFHRRTNASKLALCHLVSQLRDGGVEWIDIQMTTPATEPFRPTEISREEYMALLPHALATPAPRLPWRAGDQKQQ